MRRGGLLLLLLPVVAAGFAFADDGESVEPILSIVSRFGTDRDVKLFNDEPALFFAQAGGAETGTLLRGVRFVLYDEGGNPDRKECIREASTDLVRWGKPPSSFEYPFEGKPLPVGRYRLRASKPGWQSAEIGVVKAKFFYHALRSDHERDWYRAAFHLRLMDRTEERTTVPAEVLVETANGGLLDRTTTKLVRNISRSWLWETKAPVQISSRQKTPDRSKPEAERTGVLKLVPNCRLILVVDKIRFPWPVPLPPEERSGSVRGAAERSGGRLGR